jgi:CysZ protein
VSLVVLVIGFTPVVGTVAGAILGALVGGWFLTLELCGFAFEARGLRLRDRRRALAARRARTLGFGVATYLLFLVPFVAIVVMPAAVAGATLLTRDALGEVGAGGEPVAEAARIS